MEVRLYRKGLMAQELFHGESGASEKVHTIEDGEFHI
jgi:hypothetical protein